MRAKGKQEAKEDCHSLRWLWMHWLSQHEPVPLSAVNVGKVQ